MSQAATPGISLGKLFDHLNQCMKFRTLSMMYTMKRSEIINPPAYTNTRIAGKRGAIIPRDRPISNTTSVMPPNRKNVITYARDRNHPATRNPVRDKIAKRPRRLTSVLSILSVFLTEFGKGTSSALFGSPSVTFAEEAIAKASLTVGSRNKDQ